MRNTYLVFPKHCVPSWKGLHEILLGNRESHKSKCLMKTLMEATGRQITGKGGWRCCYRF